MSTFFRQTAQAMTAKHIGRFPLSELDQVIDWQPIEQYLIRQKTRYLRDRRGRPAHPLSSMFKAVLPGQWHSLSDPELEHSLITRIGCSTLCRYRKFRYARAAYFGLLKVGAQSHLKAMCLNLLKAANRLSAPAAA
ncbi:transposase [Neisseria gonorrhoeae]